MNKKILVLGHMRHGKDTVAQMISNETGLTFESSSMNAAKIFIYDELKQKYNYQSFEECYEDRLNHRKEWHDLICDYNKEDKARLAKNILSINDMYVGMRSNEEIMACKEQGLFDLVIGVFDPDKPLENHDSFDIDLFKMSDIIIPTGCLMKTLKNVKLICKLLV